MKVALINPPSPFLIEERVAYNSGIMRVGTHLKADGHDVKIIDLAGDKDYEDTVSKIEKYDAFGFSSTTPQFPMVYNIFKQLKTMYPDAHMTIGGAHPSSVGSLLKKEIVEENFSSLDEFDTVFMGEGESTENIFKKGWQKGALVKNIDDVLIPDRSMMDIKSYKFKIDGEPATNIMTQRGCPHQCTFCCGRDIEMYNKTRFHSPERVIEEMDELNKDYGYSHFMFYDDEVNINTGRLEKLCDALSARDYKLRGFVRSDMIVKHPESVKWMKKAGFVKLCTGVESGSDRILNLINKKTTYDINLKARKLIGDAGIHYESFLLMGHPSETRYDLELTEKWIKEAKPDDFDLNIVTPYPGSKIYDDAEKSTQFEGYDWEYKNLFFNKPNYSKEAVYYKGIGGRSAVNTRTRELSYDELFKMRDEIDARCRK